MAFWTMLDLFFQGVQVERKFFNLHFGPFKEVEGEPFSGLGAYAREFFKVGDQGVKLRGVFVHGSTRVA
jgi:hypothetical protein